jgi:hypothetical protein
MDFVDLNNPIISFEVRGKFGRPVGVGQFMLGWSMVGDSDKRAGVYQKRRRASGQFFAKLKYYRPTNPRTTIQQANRAKIAAAVAAWKILPVEEQIYWNKKGDPPHMSGYNRFIRDHLRGHI